MISIGIFRSSEFREVEKVGTNQGAGGKRRSFRVGIGVHACIVPGKEKRSAPRSLVGMWENYQIRNQ